MILRDGHGALAGLRRIGRVGIVAAACSGLATICFITALRRTTVADVLVINATAPFLAAGLAWAWTGERERRSTLLASAAALVGVTVAVAHSPADGRLLGNALALLMTVLISAMMVAIRRQRAVCMLPAAALSAFLCAALVLPWASPAAVDAGALAWLVMFGVLQFGLGLLLLTLGIRHVPAGRAALIGALETPLAPALVWLAFDEVPSPATCWGGVIVLAAVAADTVIARSR